MHKEDDVCWLLLGKMRIHNNAKTVTGSDEVKFILSEEFSLGFLNSHFTCSDLTGLYNTLRNVCVSFISQGNLCLLTFFMTNYTDRLLCGCL